MSCNSDQKYVTLLSELKGLGSSEENDEKRLNLLMKSVEIMPDRLDCIYEVLVLYYNRKNHVMAHKIGRMASDNRQNKSFTNFNAPIYNYLFDLNYSVSCYNAGEFIEAYKHGKLLLERKKYPENQEETIRSNFKFYKSKVLPADIPKTISHQDTTPTIIVIDNFLSNPDKIREFALKQEFNVTGNFPNLRTKPFANDDHKKRFEAILGRRITYYPLDKYNGSFQYTTGKNKSWIHHDMTDYSVLIFLTPNPPSNAGTKLYRHKETGIERYYDKELSIMSDGNDESKWEIVDTVGNKYNRAVFFQGKLMHRSDQYFGSCLEDGRLFQVFFFDIEGRTY